MAPPYDSFARLALVVEGLLRRHGPMTTRQLARELQYEDWYPATSAINKVLTHHLRDRVRRGPGRCWSLVDPRSTTT